MAEKQNSSLPTTSSETTVTKIPRGLIGRRGDLLNPNARLPSLKSPRDLTLGGTPKKSFKPNIPVRRERPKEEIVCPKSFSPKPSKRGRSSERGDRGRGRGRDRNKNVIQSHTSIFEDGLSGERMVRRSNKEGYGRLSASAKGDFTATQSLAKTFRNLSVKKEERDEEDSKRIAELLRDDFLQGLQAFDDEANCPVKLPLKFVDMKSKRSSKPKPVKIKQEAEENEATTSRIRIKQEPVDSDDDTPPPSINCDTPPPSIKSEPVDDFQDDAMKAVNKTKTDDKTSKGVKIPIFSRRQELEGQILFIQLPDSLPGLPPSEDDDRSNARSRAGGSSVEDSKKEKEKPARTECTLQDLPEGFLGKLQILKSGKTRLRLGAVTLDVTVGAQCNFLQDLVSVRLDEEEKRMISLGQVKHRVVCSPNLESLLASPS